MTYLEQLKQLCSEMQEISNTKEEIDRSARLGNIIEGLEQEENQTLKNYDELKASYKEAILHNSYGDKKPVDVVTDTKSLDFNEFLDEFMKNNNK